VAGTKVTAGGKITERKGERGQSTKAQQGRKGARNTIFKKMESKVGIANPSKGQKKSSYLRKSTDRNTAAHKGKRNKH